MPGKPALVPLRRAPAGPAALEACDDDSLMLLAAGEHARAFEVLTRGGNPIAAHGDRLFALGRDGLGVYRVQR